MTKTTMEGRCLCGKLSYSVDAPADWVTVCFCRFCQRATGGSGMIEPIFPREAFHLRTGEPAVYDHVSGGSGKLVHVHFCRDCGTKLWLTFERWPDRLGLYSGALDNPDDIQMTPENTKFIFLEAARSGTLVPPGIKTYQAHAATTEGAPLPPDIFEAVHEIR